jgi:hypothetical protein
MIRAACIGRAIPMNPWIAQDLARYRAEDLHRVADNHRLAPQGRQTRRGRRVRPRVGNRLIQVGHRLTEDQGPFNVAERRAPPIPVHDASD